MKKLSLLLASLAIFVGVAYGDDTTTLVASKMNKTSLELGKDILDSRMLRIYAREYYAQNPEAYSKSINKFYDDYAIVVTELDDLLNLFCLLPEKFELYDTSRGRVERDIVCSKIYRKYGVTDPVKIPDQLRKRANKRYTDYVYFLSLDKYNKLLLERVEENRNFVINSIKASDLKELAPDPLCDTNRTLCHH